MSQIADLRQQKSSLLAQAKKIASTAEKEKRVLTAEEHGQFTGLMASVHSLNTRMNRIDPNAAQKTDEPTENHWLSFGEQLGAVRAAASNKQYDPRLVAGALGANELVDSDGSFLVQPEFADGILQHTFDVGQLASRTNQFKLQRNRVILPAVDENSRANGSRWGGIQAFWDFEAGSYTSSKPKFRQMELNLNKLTGLIYLTEELSEDSMAMGQFVEQGFSDEFSFKIDDAILNGPGAGAPLGILNSDALLVIAEEGGQSATTIVTNNILKMWQRLPVRSRQDACWFINQDVEAQLYPLTLGSPSLGQILMYTPPGMNGNTSGYGLLMGRPVIPIEQAATLGTQGDIVLCDMQQYLLAQKASGIRADVSIHVAFLTGEQAFRFMLRVDGQPMWRKPLTPFNGSNTLSPFIALATRS